MRGPEYIWWANPPFSQLSKVVTKLCLEPTRMILVHPDWVDQYWSPLLRDITLSRVQIPSGTPVFVTDRKKKPLPAPMWNTQISLVNTEIKTVPPEKLDPKITKWLQRVSKNWSFSELQFEMTKYPKSDLMTSDEGTQVQVVSLPPPPVITLTPPLVNNSNHQGGVEREFQDDQRVQHNQGGEFQDDQGNQDTQGVDSEAQSKRKPFLRNLRLSSGFRIWIRSSLFAQKNFLKPKTSIFWLI